MVEHIAHLAPVVIVAGLLAGWTAETVSRDAGMVAMFVIGGAGAALAVAAQRGRWRSPPIGNVNAMARCRTCGDRR